MTEIKKMTAKEAANIQKDFMEEFNRLLSSGAVSDKTRVATLYRVALENMSERYKLDIYDYQNLRKF